MSNAGALRAVTGVLALVAAAFHIWYVTFMSLSSIIGEYFAVAGVLFLVGGVLTLGKGSGLLFKVGALGVLALAAIDNGLLYYTRTYGLGFLFRQSVRRSAGNGTASGPPPHAGAPWTTSWVPPGAVQFFVLQSAIIVVAVIAFLIVRKRSASTR